MYEYLIINILTITFPFILSFDGKVAFYKYYKPLFASMPFVSLFYIAWDVLATHRGHWSFNPDMIIGVKLFGLPLEEMLFFVTVPYACIFVYEVYLAYFGDKKISISCIPFILLGTACIACAFAFLHQEYTFAALIIMGIFLILLPLLGLDLIESRIFWLFIFTSLGLFILVNYFLTSIPVVEYGPEHMWGGEGQWNGRFVTIPLEDFIYNIGMLGIYLLVYVRVKKAFDLETKPEDPASKRVAIIGAGLGGLSAAVHLVSKGFKVEVFEQNQGPGGKANNLKLGGYRFDMGPSLFTMPSVFENVFNEAGEDMADHLELKKLDIICKYFFPDGTKLNAYGDTKLLSKEIEEKTKDNAGALSKYLNHSKTIYDLTARTFLFSSLGEASSWYNGKTLKTILKLPSLDLFKTMDEANRSYFKDKRMVQLFNRYATYNGSSPYLVKGIFNLIQHVEYNVGGYGVKGGIYSIPRSLERIAREKGVKFNYGSRIEDIVLDRSQVKGIKLNGKHRQFDVVVSNADVTKTYQDLLGDSSSKPARNYSKLEPSSSGIVFYWGIDRAFPELEVNNIFFSSDYPKEFKQIFQDKVSPDDPTVYVNITSKIDPGDAPKNCENWFVLVNTPYISGQDWDKEINRVRKAVIKRVSKALGVDIKKHIALEELLSPNVIEKKYSTNKGSIYGISSNTSNAAFLRQNNKSKKYSGLYFCGGSAHPGGGMPLVLLSGKLAAELVEKYECIWEPNLLPSNNK